MEIESVVMITMLTKTRMKMRVRMGMEETGDQRKLKKKCRNCPFVLQNLKTA